MGAKMPEDIRRSQAWVIVLIFFCCSVLLRLPNLNRPVSKHHEYNTAVILINIESWRRAGGGDRFNFVPLMNFQNFGDKSRVKSPAVDDRGNTMYLSFGPGWYVIPYFFYQVMDWPVEPIYLQLLNLIFELGAVIMFFLLSERLISSRRQGRYRGVIVACILFIFSPAIMWYMGNGYVNTGIMLPLLMGVLLLMAPMVQSPVKMPAWRLGLIFLLTVILVYIDWFVIFFGAVACVWSLFRLKKDKKYWLLILTIGLGCTAGVALIFFQLASYAGMHNVLLSWQGRFRERSLTHTGDPVYLMVLVILRHVVSSYLPVLLLLGWSFVRMKFYKADVEFSRAERRIMGIYAVAVLLYNFVLMDWSFEHEFALVPLSILVCYIGARVSMSWISGRNFNVIIGVFVLLSLGQYYAINRPGKVSQDGTRFDAYKKLGKEVEKLPEDYTLFMDREWIAPIDYYARRNINMMPNIDSARAFIHKWGISKALWIEHNHYKMEKAVVIQ